MEWPYDHPRRGDMPPELPRALAQRIQHPPAAVRRRTRTYKHVYSYVQGWGGSDYIKNIVVDEKEHPYTGTNYAWVRARLLGGKTNIWGRLALRLSDYDFKGKTHDGYGEDWPISYADIEPYYDKVDLLPRHLRPQGEPAASAGQHVPAPYKLNAARGAAAARRCKKMGRDGDAVSRRRHDRRREETSTAASASAAARAAAASGGCDIHAAFDSPTGLIYPGAGHRQADASHQRHRARDHGRSGDRARRAASRSSTRSTRQVVRGKAKAVVARGVDARVGAPAAALEVAAASQRHRQLERPRRPQLLRAPDGAAASPAS